MTAEWWWRGGSGVGRRHALQQHSGSSAVGSSLEIFVNDTVVSARTHDESQRIVFSSVKKSLIKTRRQTGRSHD